MEVPLHSIFMELIRKNKMKKVIIIGASGGLAHHVIDAINTLDDVQLTLFARNTNKISNGSNAILIQGDALNYLDLKNAISGQDLVYVNLAGDLEAMTMNIVKAMHENQVERIIAISSIGIYNSPLSPILIPYRKLADIIESSGLDFTILRPNWFTNENEINYHITSKPEPEIGTAISKKSIAAFIAKLVKEPKSYTNENLGISKV